jgi:hypothetical protein
MIKKIILSFFIFLQAFGEDSNEAISLFMPVPATGSGMALESRGNFFDHLNKFLNWIMGFTRFEYQGFEIIKMVKEPPNSLVKFEENHGFFSKIQPLIGQYTPLKEDIEPILKVLEQIDKEILDPSLRLFYFQEILAKVLAYRFLEEGDELRLPDFFNTNNSSIYKVEKIFNLGMGMPAFALTSKNKDKSSILIYRGTTIDITQSSSFASIVADLDLYGPGYSSFFKIEDQLKAFLIKEELNQKKCVVLGYSLGGILSVYTGLFFSKYIDFEKSAAFNPPGVQKKLYQLAQKEKFLDSFKVYVNQDDPISKWGFLVGDVSILSLNASMGPLMAHTQLMGSQSDLTYRLCNLNEENQRHRYFFLPE